MKTSAIVLAGLLAVSVPAFADEAYDQCIAAGSPHNECGEAWVAREEAAMRAAWTEVHEQTGGAVETALAAEQKAWEIYKESACGFMLDENFAPEGDHTSFLKCRAGVIADRARVIGVYAKYVDN
jgi:hypothetical protein